MIRTLTLIAMAFVALLTFQAPAHAAGEMKPFFLASKGAGSMEASVADATAKLQGAGFEVAGTYSPYKGATVIIVTSDALKAAAAKTEFGAYGVVQRISVTEVNGEIQVSYTNPSYMAAAYRMDGNMADVTAALNTALGNQGEFGPDKGLTDADLRDYHYAFLMEYFDDPSKLASYNDYASAVAGVEAALANNTAGVTKVARVDVPGKEETYFAVGLSGDLNNNNEKFRADEFIMGEIDFKELRSTAHLPYEIVVSGDRVYALYARFRIAINFPDLSMMGDNSFMNIMASPEAIRKALTLASGGEFKEK
ncbi:hypothetical protein [Magnetovibrio sp.]|uniref:hypothetical protein n=1 Tax=Magnetovibrio sp. TaxID=2024836 RepID=UPI002F9264C6